jgi:hypothetical protein
MDNIMNTWKIAVRGDSSDIRTYENMTMKDVLIGWIKEPWVTYSKG